MSRHHALNEVDLGAREYAKPSLKEIGGDASGSMITKPLHDSTLGRKD